MSISVYVGHTGQRFLLDPSSASTIEALRSWIATQSSIQPRNQILLTAQGKQARAQTLLTENELFVFDSGWLNGKLASSSTDDASDDAATVDFDPGAAPDTIGNQNELHAWQELFRLRKSWATGLLQGCSGNANQAEIFREEQAVIERSLRVAVASLQQHIKSAEKQYGSSEAWSNELTEEQSIHVKNWEYNLESLRNVPARSDFARFVQSVGPTSGSRRLSQQSNVTTLQGFVDVAAIRKAAGTAKSIMTNLATKMNQMRDSLNTAAKDSNELSEAVNRINDHTSDSSASEPAQLVEEIEMVVKKMASDLDHVQSLPRTVQSVSQASKIALLHTRNYLPNLNDYCSEMNDLVRRNKQQREAAADLALEHMRKLSGIESQLAHLYADLKQLDIPDDQHQVFAMLATISRLPPVYGQLLVESVRRREWVAKMKRDSATLQEEVAMYQEEEEKRRKKWFRAVEDVVNPDAWQSRVLGIELNLQNEGGSWPMTTREEVDEYFKILVETYGQGPVTEEMDQAIKDLDKPTRKQIKHAKAFKNGSLHEAAFGDTSLMLRGDDQHKTLRETNGRLEDELKAHRSRIRKLEDLLHRQTQTSRNSTGDVFTPQSDAHFPHLASGSPFGSTPRPFDEFSAHDSSKNQRRQSLVQATEEKRLAKRVVDLEAELQNFKDEATSRRTSDAQVQKQVEEAVSTKRDLMENMEAQQREFADERRSLEKDLAEAKEKNEELENEIERLVGSREGVDEEIAKLKDVVAGNAARAATEQDNRITLESKLKNAEAAKSQADEVLKKIRADEGQRREVETEHLLTLANAHVHLSEGSESPSGLAALATALEELARKSTAHAKDLEDAVAYAKSENESLWSSNERQKTELVSITQRHADIEEQIRQANDTKDAEEAKSRSLEQQLAEEQEQLRILRSKFAEGETGSEVLRQRVAHEEARAGNLASDLAEAKSHINSLDVELTRLQRKHQSYNSSTEALAERLEKRAERSKELSQRLYSQNARLGRLLERLGLAVSYQDDAMVIERASKMGASTNMVDPSGQLQRTVTLTSPPPTRKSSTNETDSAPDLSLLHWADAQSSQDESIRFQAFLNQISRLDMDVFSDAVTKRVKDFEYTAKKYSKEAKEGNKRADGYKERAIKLRNEAHAKIAVRDFKEGDLTLFLPTRGGQVKGAWAAFNIGCPHYFLAEREGMRLGTRDFIVARIQKVEQKVVDLSGQRGAASSIVAERKSIDDTRDAPSFLTAADDNPFDLSDGLTWWMVHAVEERGAGAAPTTPGLGKSTVAAANVDATGSIRIKRNSKNDDASKHLNKSLDSRRSSSASKRSFAGAVPGITSASPTVATFADSSNRPHSDSLTPTRPPTAPHGNSALGIVTDYSKMNESGDGNGNDKPISPARTSPEQVRHDLLWGP